MIVACTGHIEDSFIRKAFEHQMDEVMAKPASIELLEQILEEVVDFEFQEDNL